MRASRRKAAQKSTESDFGKNKSSLPTPRADTEYLAPLRHQLVGAGDTTLRLGGMTLIWLPRTD
jgi:hypothetical protein